MIVPLVALLLQNPPPAPASAAAPARVIHVWLGSASPLVRGAAVRVYVEAGQDGNLVVLHRRTDGRIEVLFPKNPATDPFVRAGTYEIRGGDEQAAWVVAEPDGSGMVLAALSPDPLRFDEFVRAAAWDSAALVPTWSGADAAGSMSDIVQRMLGDGYFNYDVVTYRVAPPVYAQQDMTPQETAPAYDPYPACVDCTFIGEQLVFYERVLGRRHFRREPDREPRQQPMRGLALALGPRSTVGPQPLSSGSRSASSPHHVAGPVPIEPRPRTHVRYTRLSAPAPERSMVVIALPAGAGAAPIGRARLAVAHADVVSSRGAVRSDFPGQGREPAMPAAAGQGAQGAVRSRAMAVARTGAAAAQGGSQGVAIPREAWGYTRRTSLRR